MKYLFLLFSFFFLTFTNQPKALSGKYKMIFEDEYRVENGIINFKRDSYSRKPDNGKNVKGIIDYQKYFTYLKDNKTDIQILVPTRDIGKDTIPFSTERIDAIHPEGDIIIFTGKMIRIK